VQTIKQQLIGAIMNKSRFSTVLPKQHGVPASNPETVPGAAQDLAIDPAVVGVKVAKLQRSATQPLE